MVQGLLCTEYEQCASESAPVHNVENADTPQQSTPLPPSSPPSLIPSTPEHQPATEQPLPRCTRALCVVRPAAALVSEPRHLGHTPVPNPSYFYTELLAAVFMGQDPATYVEVMSSPEAEDWKEVCQYEMDVLVET